MKALIIVFVTLILGLFFSSQPIDYIANLNRKKTTRDATLVKLPKIKMIPERVSGTENKIPIRPVFKQYFTYPEVIRRGSSFHKTGLEIPEVPLVAVQNNRPIINYRKRNEFV